MALGLVKRKEMSSEDVEVIFVAQEGLQFPSSPVHSSMMCIA